MDWNSNRSFSSKIKNESGEKLALYQLLESDMLYILKFLFTNLCILLQSNGHLVYFWGCITVHTKKGMDTWVWGRKDCGFSSLSRNNTPKNGRKWENTWVVAAHYNVVVVLMTKGRRCYLAYSTLLCHSHAIILQPLPSHLLQYQGEETGYSGLHNASN